MFGYATDETDECMPLTLVLAHKLNARLHDLRRNGTLPWARPDSKSQVLYLKSVCFIMNLMQSSVVFLCMFVLFHWNCKSGCSFHLEKLAIVT